MALLQAILDNVSPDNPKPGETVTADVKIIPTEFSRLIGECVRVSFTATIKVDGNNVKQLSGTTLCGGDEAIIETISLSLSQGSHTVRVEGTIYGLEEDSSVSDTAGTINVSPAPASISNTSVSTAENEASLSYTVTNPNSTQVTVTVKHAVQGSRVGTVDVTVPGGSSQSNSFTATFSLSQDTDVELCADVINTEA